MQKNSVRVSDGISAESIKRTPDKTASDVLKRISGASIQSGYLEGSNVNMAVGLTDMIVMQRAYQANAKTITTVDDMIQKALAMHR